MQNNLAVNSKRREKDVHNLCVLGKFDIKLVNPESTQEFDVKFPGPKDSPYEGGMWIVRVQLPDMYPYKSPSIGFKNRIFHPNIDEQSGSVCLDVINQTWSPMYDLINIFEIFLPQLLLYPNPTDPLNPEAAQMQLRYEAKYQDKIKQYVKQYASGVETVKVNPEPTSAKKLNGVEKTSPTKQGGDNLSETSLNNEDDDDEDEEMLDDEDLDKLEEEQKTNS